MASQPHVEAARETNVQLKIRKRQMEVSVHERPTKQNNYIRRVASLMGEYEYQATIQASAGHEATQRVKILQERGCERARHRSCKVMQNRLRVKGHDRAADAGDVRGKRPSGLKTCSASALGPGT